MTSSSSSLNCTHIAVLSGFSSDLDQIGLPGEIRLRRITRDDYCFLRALGDRVDGVVNYWWNLELEDVDFALSHIGPIPNGASLDAFKSRSRFERVVTCLRLLEPGSVKIAALACWPTDQPTPEDWPSDDVDGDLKLPYGSPLEGAGYHLAQESKRKLELLTSRLGEALTYAPIRTALSFFNQSYEYFRTKTMMMGFEGIDLPRDTAAKHDKLIRLWMCLEALLMGRRERSDIGASVGRKAEVLLDKQSRETCVKSWHLRCDTVHGEDPRQFDTVLGMTEKETRRLLARVVQDPSSLRLIRPD